MFLTLRSKILVGYLLIVLLLAGLGVYAVMSFRSFTTLSNKAFEQVSQADRSNLAIYESLIRLNEAEVDLLGSSPVKGMEMLSSEPAKVSSELTTAEKIISSIPSDLSPGLAAAFTKEEILWHQYQAQLPEFLRRIKDDPIEAGKFYDGVLIPTYGNLTTANRNLATAISKLFERTRQLASEESADAVSTVILITVLSLLIGIGASILIGRQTTKPLEQIRASLKKLQAGDLSARLQVEGVDELGAVSFEFNRMAERLEGYEKLNIDRLVAEKSKSEAVILSFTDPLFLFDAGNKLLLANRSAEELLSRKEAEMIGDSVESLFLDKSVLEAIRLESERKQPQVLEFIVNKKRKFYTISKIEIVAPTSEQGSTVVGTLLHFADITHFEELDRLKNDFLAKVSHEFRTPLTSIRMALDLLADAKIGSLNTEQRELVLTSKMDSDRLTKLIRDLLTVTRIEQHRTDGVTETIDAVAVATSLLASMQRQFTEKNILLSSILPNVLQTRMKQEHFESILQNLLSNALVHTPSGGRVRVDLTSNDSKWQLQVSDTGVGIAEADLSRIFERFVQLKPTDAATPGSIGLGLAIVKELVELYRGSINVTSKVGEGTTFTLQFLIQSDTHRAA
ncbi:MAG TPA: ATP-binding protein [Candidatus Kapabacteria bacterium]|nr:ATP-binding protein [Candidatus Kapabacteria bacterium]